MLLSESVASESCNRTHRSSINVSVPSFSFYASRVYCRITEPPLQTDYETDLLGVNDDAELKNGVDFQRWTRGENKGSPGRQGPGSTFERHLPRGVSPEGSGESYRRSSERTRRYTSKGRTWTTTKMDGDC